MLGRKSHGLTQRLSDVGGDLADGGVATAKRVITRGPGKVDTAAAGALMLGMGNWLSMSLFNFDAVKAVAGAKSTSGRATYGALGLAALYATMRGARKASR
jgi:uncharacterized membrane protein YuzA (DUF378 family)